MTAASVRRADVALSEAFARVHGRPPSPNERVVLLSHAHLESGFGRARYRKYPIAADGEIQEWCGPLFNWGAVHGHGDAGSCYPAVDTMDGTAATQYRTHIAAYSSDAAGAAAFVAAATTGRRAPALAAASSGDTNRYAEILRATTYFTAPLAGVQRGYAERAEVIADRLGVPWPPRFRALSRRDSGVAQRVIIFSALAVIATVALTRK